MMRFGFINKTGTRISRSERKQSNTLQKVNRIVLELRRERHNILRRQIKDWKLYEQFKHIAGSFKVKYFNE